jgi:predicted aspartyl protease
VRIDGRPYWLLVDSGASRLALEPWAALELGLITEAEAARHAKRAGASGGGRTTRLRVGPVEVAGLTVPSVKAIVVNTFDGAADGDIRPAGLLGLAAFGDRVWTLDYGRRRLAVEE